ncbi:hypothetical protein LUZ60_016711 [Juncus effusus]|nr:hypothetical protein LUZ60_016711 [Juncus effusus]
MGRPRKESTKAAGKKKATASSGRKIKKVKDPNKPKRPPSAFFVFMEEFREEFKAKNPKNKLVSVVSKAGGDRWKSMSDADKAPYQAKAEKRKEEYNKVMDAYNKKPEKSSKSKEEDEDDEEAAGSDKSKSEVEDEGEGSDDEEEDDD